MVIQAHQLASALLRQYKNQTLPTQRTLLRALRGSSATDRVVAQSLTAAALKILHAGRDGFEPFLAGADLEDHGPMQFATGLLSRMTADMSRVMRDVSFLFENREILESITDNAAKIHREFEDDEFPKTPEMIDRLNKLAENNPVVLMEILVQVAYHFLENDDLKNAQRAVDLIPNDLKQDDAVNEQVFELEAQFQNARAEDPRALAAEFVKKIRGFDAAHRLRPREQYEMIKRRSADDDLRASRVVVVLAQRLAKLGLIKRAKNMLTTLPKTRAIQAEVKPYADFVEQLKEQNLDPHIAKIPALADFINDDDDAKFFRAIRFEPYAEQAKILQAYMDLGESESAKDIFASLIGETRELNNEFLESFWTSFKAAGFMPVATEVLNDFIRDSEHSKLKGIYSFIIGKMAKLNEVSVAERRQLLSLVRTAYAKELALQNGDVDPLDLLKYCYAQLLDFGLKKEANKLIKHADLDGHERQAAQDKFINRLEEKVRNQRAKNESDQAAGKPRNLLGELDQLMGRRNYQQVVTFAKAICPDERYREQVMQNQLSVTQISALRTFVLASFVINQGYKQRALDYWQKLKNWRVIPEREADKILLEAKSSVADKAEKIELEMDGWARVKKGLGASYAQGRKSRKRTRTVGG